MKLTELYNFLTEQRAFPKFAVLLLS